MTDRPIILRRTHGGEWKPLSMGDWVNGCNGRQWVAGFDVAYGEAHVARMNRLHAASGSGIELRLGFCDSRY